jgi:hypothetical protein
MTLRAWRVASARWNQEAFIADFSMGGNGDDAKTPEVGARGHDDLIRGGVADADDVLQLLDLKNGLANCALHFYHSLGSVFCFP